MLQASRMSACPIVAASVPQNRSSASSKDATACGGAEGVFWVRLGTNGVIAIGTLCLAAIMVGAIAHQEFSWWVFPFILLFGTVFAGILGLCFLNYREDRLRRASVENYSDQPWMWDARWRSDNMTSRSKSELWGTLAFAIILGMFALIGVATLLEGLPEGNLWVLLNLIPIVAAVYFGRNTYVAWRTLRLEEHLSLTNETRPAWIGSRFSAVMETGTGQQVEHLNAWLEHFKVVRREENDGIAFERVVDCKLPAQAEYIGHGKTRVSVDIPEKSPETSWSEDGQKRWWDLVIATEVSGSEVSLRYEIPVADPAKHQRSGA